MAGCDLSVHQILANFTCPDDIGTATCKDPYAQFYNISYSFNYGYLGELGGQDLNHDLPSPGCGAGNQWFSPKLQSQVIMPSSIVMFVDSGGKQAFGNTASTLGSMVNPPDANPSTEYFYSDGTAGWGQGAYNYYENTPGNWANTGGFAWRHTGGGNACFVDGHAKFQRIGTFMSGTTNPTLALTADQTTVATYTTYQWDPKRTQGAQSSTYP